MAAASICTAPYMCSEPKHAANHGARSVLAAKKDEGRVRDGFRLCDGRHGADSFGAIYRRRDLYRTQGKRRRFLMPIFFAAVGTPLYDLAAGALLGANVYIMIRGGKGYLKGRKK